MAYSLIFPFTVYKVKHTGSLYTEGSIHFRFQADLENKNLSQLWPNYPKLITN